MCRIAIFPGSFDPFTIGHDSVVRRALPLFDKIIIGVGVNADKKPLFTVEKRVEFIKSLYEKEPRIEVLAYDTLTIAFAQKVHANYILRGLRSVRDFEYEREQADINRQLSGVETVLLFSEPHLSSISSTMVRELQHFGVDVSAYLPSKS